MNAALVVLGLVAAPLAEARTLAGFGALLSSRLLSCPACARPRRRVLPPHVHCPRRLRSVRHARRAGNARTATRCVIQSCVLGPFATDQVSLRRKFSAAQQQSQRTPAVLAPQSVYVQPCACSAA